MAKSKGPMNLPWNINHTLAKTKGQMNLPKNIYLIVAKSKGQMRIDYIIVNTFCSFAIVFNFTCILFQYLTLLLFLHFCVLICFRTCTVILGRLETTLKIWWMNFKTNQKVMKKLNPSVIWRFVPILYGLKDSFSPNCMISWIYVKMEWKNLRC